MASYRGIDVSDRLRPVIPYMEPVGESREALMALAQRWDLLDVLGRVMDAQTGVDHTRREFGALNDALIDALADESLKKVTASTGSRAQVVVDIVIRNLFERTADVGFLATDEDLRLFLTGAAAAPGSAAIGQRLGEYRAKYSVYGNVVILDAGGQVMAAAEMKGLPARCADGFVARALTTTDSYVESFAPSDLADGPDSQLIYACRITDAAGRSVGVLALLFRFADELAGVFGKLLDADDWTVLTLLDAGGAVLASSDPAQVPVGIRLSIDPGTEYQLLRHAGRRYIATARMTNGYQGYAGPGWRGCAMIPLDVAFADGGDDGDGAGGIDDGRRQAISGNRALFSDAVRDIPRRAAAIEAALNRTVWNGALGTAGEADGAAKDMAGAIDGATARRTLRGEISATGARTRQVFANAIDRLHRTVVGAIVADCAASAALAIDIMDRNLYERANDCRWWALTTRFRELLARPDPGDEGRGEMTAVLSYINGLYTVYTNLILFDAAGRVQAVSDPETAALVGTLLPTQLTQRFISRADPAFYGVSDFAATPLYGDRPTYIYGAPVLHPVEPGRIVGGIAIVFDGEGQFRSMLEDSLPRHAGGGPIAGGTLVFVDARGRIVSSSDADHVVGTILDRTLATGPAGVTAWRGSLYATGAAASVGYREYKGPADAYRNDLRAVCLVRLGEHDSAAMGHPTPPMAGPTPSTAVPVTGGRRIATFAIGDHRLALPGAAVVEAIVPDRIARIARRRDAVAGYTEHGGRGIPVLDPRPHFGLSPGIDPARPLIVFRTERGICGLAVDALGEVMMVAPDRIQPTGLGNGGGDGVTGMIYPGHAGPAITLLDAEALAAVLLTGDTEPAVRDTAMPALRAA